MKTKVMLCSILLAVFGFTAYSLTVGVNLPWVRYGWDVGENPWNKGRGDGFATHRNELDAKLKIAHENHLEVVRGFLFADCRTGIQKKDERLILDEYALPDIRAFLEAVKENKSQESMPVLFDWTIADGEAVGPNSLGEHPEYILDPKQRRQILELLVPVFVLFSEYKEQIRSIDLFNEPEHAKVLMQSWNGQVQMYAFLSELSEMLKKYAPEVKVTIGTASADSMLYRWNSVPQDEYQFHYYFSPEFRMPPVFQFNALNQQVLIGEFECRNVGFQLDWAKRSGYPLVMFWSLSGHDKYWVDLEGVRKWKEKNYPAD